MTFSDLVIGTQRSIAGPTRMSKDTETRQNECNEVRMGTRADGWVPV